MRKIYLACPYSHSNELIRAERAQAVTQAAARLMADGHFVYSPITHGHALGEAYWIDPVNQKARSLPGDWTFWQGHCLSFLTHWADALYVLMLNGWRESVGVKAELELARNLGLPVKFIELHSGYLTISSETPSVQELIWQVMGHE